MEGDEARLPRSLGRFELLHELASGGMATVYLARAMDVAERDRFVAIKVCHPHLRHEDEFATMFIDEARLASRIHHRNVIATYDPGEIDRRALFMAMEFVDGYSLWQLLHAAGRRGERMPVSIVGRIVVDALRGLHAAHELRDDNGAALHLVHRDVSPHNVLVGVDGVARIMDFGIAKAASRLSVTREGCVKGKLGYMAPEQHGFLHREGRHAVSRRTDIYAAGVVLWEALAGRKLFTGETDADTVSLLMRAEVPPLAAVHPGVGPEIDAVIARALQREPAARFATANEFADALEGSRARLATSATVGEYVRDAMATAIARRRAILEQLCAQTPRADVSQVAYRIRAPITIDAPTEAPAANPPTATTAPIALQRARSVRTPVSWLIAGMALLIAASAAGAFALHALRGGESRPNARRASDWPASSSALATLATLSSAAVGTRGDAPSARTIAPTREPPSSNARGVAPHRHGAESPATRPRGHHAFRPQFL